MHVYLFIPIDQFRSMLIIDIHQHHINTYSCNQGAIQKATTHLSWSNFLPTLPILQKIHKNIILLIDETECERYHLSISLHTHTPFTRSEYQHLIHEKKHWISKKLGIPLWAIQSVTKNQKIQNQRVEFLLGWKWHITFDLCMTVIPDIYREIISSTQIQIQPRRQAFLSHPLITHNKCSVLVVESNRSLLMTFRNGRYTSIKSLNWWDDLMYQSYENIWLDPLQIWNMHILKNTLWEKLMLNALKEFTSLIIQWISDTIPPWETLILISRLTKQPNFTQTISDAYIHTCRGRLVPYTGNELDQKSQRKRDDDELSVLLTIQHKND
jgi:hypothetical protein